MHIPNLVCSWSEKISQGPENKNETKNKTTATKKPLSPSGPVGPNGPSQWCLTYCCTEKCTIMLVHQTLKSWNDSQFLSLLFGMCMYLVLTHTFLDCTRHMHIPAHPHPTYKVKSVQSPYPYELKNKF